MRKIEVLIVLILIFSSIHSDTNLVLNFNTNSFNAIYLPVVNTNPAAISHSYLVSYFVGFKNEFTLDSLGAVFPVKALMLGVGVINNAPNYEYSTGFKYNVNQHLHAGFSFNTIYRNAVKNYLYYRMNLGIVYYPFAKEFKEMGSLTDLAISFYLNNYPISDEIKNDYPLKIGSGLGFFHKKDTLNLFFSIEYSRKEDFDIGIGSSIKLSKNMTVHSGLRIQGASIGFEYNYMDLNLILGFNRSNGINTTRVYLNIIPGFRMNKLVNVYLNEGIENYKSGNFLEAYDTFNRILVMMPEHSDARQFLDLTKNRLSKEGEFEVNKSILNVLNLIKDGDIANAEKEFELIRKKYPRFEHKWKMLYNRVSIEKPGIEEITPASKTDDLYLAKAIDDFKKTVFQIRKLLKNGDILEAKLMFESIDRIPKDIKSQHQSDYNLLKGEMIFETNKAVEKLLEQINDPSSFLALEHYKEILLLDPGHALAKKSIISYYLKNGEKLYREHKFTEAIEEWTKVYDYDPDDSNARLYIETAKKRLNQ